jgi:hypothetical protein
LLISSINFLQGGTEYEGDPAELQISVSLSNAERLGETTRKRLNYIYRKTRKKESESLHEGRPMGCLI